jgi:hypothetical protein
MSSDRPLALGLAALATGLAVSAAPVFALSKGGGGSTSSVGVITVQAKAEAGGMHNVAQGNPVNVSSGGLRNLGPNLCGTASCR